MQGPEVDALASQLWALNSLVAGLPEDDFASPTRCPGWTVAELVAHCEGMLIRLVGENAQAVDGAAEIDRVGYYRYDPEGPREGEDPDKTFSEIIQERVIEEVAERNPSQLKASLDGAQAGAVHDIRTIPADRVIKRSGHPRMTFGEFVASRNLEFGVHTMDIANAVGAPEQVDPSAAAIITGILGGLLGEPLPADLGWDTTTFSSLALADGNSLPRSGGLSALSLDCSPYCANPEPLDPPSKTGVSGRCPDPLGIVPGLVMAPGRLGGWVARTRHIPDGRLQPMER